MNSHVIYTVLYCQKERGNPYLEKELTKIAFLSHTHHGQRCPTEPPWGCKLPVFPDNWSITWSINVAIVQWYGLAGLVEWLPVERNYRVQNNWNEMSLEVCPKQQANLTLCDNDLRMTFQTWLPKNQWQLFSNRFKCTLIILMHKYARPQSLMIHFFCNRLF